MSRRSYHFGSLVVIGLVAVSVWLGLGDKPPEPTVLVQAQLTESAQAKSAFDNKQSGIWLELSADVIKTLADDNDGSRHQRFIIKLDNKLTLLVAHNIDLAPRVPLTTGDAVRVKGRYEWNKKGGVMHWTHHDPKQKIPGGWIEHQGKRYF